MYCHELGSQVLQYVDRGHSTLVTVATEEKDAGYLS